MATIYTSKGEPILVDDEDYEWLNQYKWSIHKGYATAAGKRVNGKQSNLIMHRLIMNAPTGMLVDHRNHQRSDNRRSNLRIVTAKENQNNLTPQRKMIYDEKSGKYWLIRGYELIGIYDTKEEQTKAWLEAKYGRAPSVTNTAIPID